MSRRWAGSPERIQTMSSEEELTSVFTGAPSPRPLGIAAASMVKLLPEAESTITWSVVLHSSVCSDASPSLKLKELRSSAWPVRARIQPFCERITVIGSTTTVRSTCERSAVLISVRRSSPYFFASSSSSRTTSFFSSLSSPSRALSSLRSALSAFSSSASLMPSSLVSCPRRRLTMSSACFSESLYFDIRFSLASRLVLGRADQLDDLDRSSRMPRGGPARCAAAPRRGRAGTGCAAAPWRRGTRPIRVRMSTMPLVSGRPSQAEPGQVDRVARSPCWCAPAAPPSSLPGFASSSSAR